MSDVLLSIQDNVTYLIDKENTTSLITTNDITKLISLNTNDILLSEVEQAYILTDTLVGPQGEAGPTSGITDATDALVYIGSGTGSSKTTTELHNNAIFEKFGVGDEIYTQWLIPDDIHLSYAQWFYGNFFSVTSEVGTFCSWEIHITTQEHNAPQYTGVIYATDLPLNETAYVPTEGSAELAAGVYIDADTVVAHIRLKRVASSNDPTDGVGVLNLHTHYTSDGRVGAEGAPGGEDEVALEKRIDFNDEQDIIYKGESVPGTADSAASWRIRKLTIASDSDVREMWADGTANYIKVWDDRLTYTYT